MICKNCGAELADNAKFCSSCGAAQEAEVQQPVAPAEPVEEVVAAPAQEPAAPAEAAAPAEPKANPLLPLIEKAKPFVQKYKLPLAGAACVLLLIIAISIIVSVCGGGNGFIASENAMIATVDDDMVIVLWNKKMIETKIEADYIEEQVTNLDGTVLAFLTNEGDLCVAKGKKVTKVAEDVAYFELSVDGSGIAFLNYSDDECNLCLYNVGSKKTVTAVEDCDFTSMSYYGFELAPDGDSLAYYDFDVEEFEATLMFFNGKKSIKITSSEVELLGLSNDGKYIYAIAENDGVDTLYAYNKKGDRDKIGVCTNSTVYFNDDHTQILYLNEGKTYCSVKGKEGTKLSSSKAALITSTDSASFSCGSAITYPVADLFNHVYAVYNDGQYNLWLLKKNFDKSVKLVSDVSDWMLDADCEYVYYLDDNGCLCVLKISHGDDASDKAKLLAEDVENYVVTSDRKKVYFISDDALYSCNAKNGNSKKTVASDDVSAYYLVLNAKDVVYYILDGDCYACSNGRKGTKVLSDAEGLMGYGNGVVYAGTDDTLYVTDGSKKLTKLYEND